MNYWNIEEEEEEEEGESADLKKPSFPISPKRGKIKQQQQWPLSYHFRRKFQFNICAYKVHSLLYSLQKIRENN